MSTDATELDVSKPVSAWNKPLKADFNALFKALTKAVIYGVAGKAERVATELVDAVMSVSLVEDSSQIAYELIRKSMDGAIVELASQFSELLSPCAPADLENLTQRIELTLEAAELRISGRVIEQPETLSLLQPAAETVELWFTIHGVAKQLSATIARRLPGYYTAAFHREWVRNPSRYEKILPKVESPALKSLHRDRAWLAYSASISELMMVPIPGHALVLEEVLVPLNAYYVRNAPPLPAVASRDKIRNAGRASKVVVLQYALLDWFERGDPADALRVISGPPGSGKSTAIRQFAVEAVRRSIGRVLFVERLTWFEGMDLMSALESNVLATGLLPSEIAHTIWDEPRLLVVIDESSRTLEEKNAFLQQLLRFVSLRNQISLRLQIVFTGEQLWAEIHASQFLTSDSIFHLLPYFISEEGRSHFEDPAGRLSVDLRDEWWSKFAVKTGLKGSKMPAALRSDALMPFTVNPRLNYWLSLVHDAVTSGAALHTSQVFELLLQRIFESRFVVREAENTRNLDFEGFEKILRDAAWAFWHNQWQPLPLAQVPSLPGLELRGRASNSIARAAFGLLPIVFYSSVGLNARQPAERAAVFTHPAFGEFLVARSVAQLIETRLKTKMATGVSDPQMAEMMAWWMDAFGPSPMSREMLGFLQHELSQIQDEQLRHYQSTLIKLVETFVGGQISPPESGICLANARDSLTEQNAAEAALAVLSLCSALTKQIAAVRWPTATAAGEWMYRLQGQRPGPANRIALSSLCWLDLHRCILDIHDLYRADLSHANLDEAKLMHAFLAEARLEDANLHRAKLTFSRCQNASLIKANLSQADLFAANLAQADLRDSNCPSAYLRAAVCTEADLRGACLMWADLQGANLEGCDLRKTDFTGANLFGTNLRRAKLAGAIFTNAMLRQADLLGAEDILQANFHGADLEGAKVDNAIGETQAFRQSQLIKIEAIIRPFKLEDVKNALTDLGCGGMTVSEVRRPNSKPSERDVYSEWLPYIKIEVVAVEHQQSAFIQAISKAAKTGKRGDGKIFVNRVELAIKIRTGEIGAWAL